MKKLFFFLSLLLSLATAQALPFVPTDDPHLSSTKWYYLKIDGRYVQGQYDATWHSYATSMSSAPSGTHVDQWCFVNDGNGKYKAYNREYERYLCDDGYLESDINNEYAVYYRERTSDTFYLLRSYISDGATVIMNLYYDTEENALMTEGTTGNVLHGYFSAQYADQGGDDPNPQPTWTRYDASGVGYKFVAGGPAAVANEGAANLCDGNAETKFYGASDNCWITMQASQAVSVQQYSLVTANDSRGYYNRSLRNWKLQGSNDNLNWVDIDIQNNYPMPFDDQVEVVIHVDDTRKFTYFRFSCTGGVTNSSTATVQLSEVWINEQAHGTWGYYPNVYNGCGHPMVSRSQCSDCHVNRKQLLEPTTDHTYVNGICTECGIGVNETMLLYNGQCLTPYYVKAYCANRISDNVWPSAPNAWNAIDMDDSKMMDLALPTASYNHSGGPFTSLQYNSYWYDEYNCYWLRREFNISQLVPNATYTLRCVHDDNMVVYVNGQEVINVEGWTVTPNNSTWYNSFESFNIPASAFREGKNVLAVYIQQNWGGAYFDCDLRMNQPSNIPGDVNGDGFVTSADVTALYDVMLNNDYSQIVNGDQNNDGHITAADVTAIYDILLGN